MNNNVSVRQPSREDFAIQFKALTGHPPFPWQSALFQKFTLGEIPAIASLPTGMGKTSIIAVWLLALAHTPNHIPRRLVYVVNRRTVVDQTTDEVEKIRRNLDSQPELSVIKAQLGSLALSTLRGQFADNREWSGDPSRPAVIAGTVDMIGSRLLFSGYGIGFKTRPLHAGFLGQDTLLIHDEAHLEPAFQNLLAAIEEEQRRCKEFMKFHVMELSATARGKTPPFTLTADEQAIPAQIPDPPTEPVHVVWRRQAAKKTILLHEVSDEKKDLPVAVLKIALTFKDSLRAILIFMRTVDGVKSVVASLHSAKQQVQQLTGTLRGMERDNLAKSDPIFQRFLQDSPTGLQTVYLVCTAAGEVGVNISADHLICDLSPFDSMAQRFGRVNRFGHRSDTEIHIVHPNEEALKGIDEPVKIARARTMTLVKALVASSGDGSPRALSALPADERQAAFSPTPIILPVSDILFDNWAMTSIRDRLPGRPPVGPYLHGLCEWEPPETHVAWREEVSLISGDLLKRYPPEDLLEDFPLKPQELLRDKSDRVMKDLEKIAERHANAPIWIIDEAGAVSVSSLAALIDKKNKKRNEIIEGMTLLLPPEVGGLKDGLLTGSSPEANDVAHEWLDAQAHRRRLRVWDGDPAPQGMRLIRTIDTRPESLDDDEVVGRRHWRWYEQPASADGEGSFAARQPVRLLVHLKDVEENAERITKGLPLSENLRRAIIFAGRCHDLGKARELWQRSIGNPDPGRLLAKSGVGMKPLDLTPYRHEFGSLFDISQLPDFKSLGDDLQDLVLHLVAAHHGRARPHFSQEEAFDPNAHAQRVTEMTEIVPVRFVRLQRRYGRWGLAYLESLVRAADYAASAAPSEFDAGGAT